MSYINHSNTKSHPVHDYKVANEKPIVSIFAEFYISSPTVHVAFSNVFCTHSYHDKPLTCLYLIVRGSRHACSERISDLGEYVSNIRLCSDKPTNISTA
jgi:hypothetical protein